MEAAGQAKDLRIIGSAIAGAVQPNRTLEDKRVGGTLYSSFISISHMEFVLGFKLNNNKITRLDLKEEFKKGDKKRIKLN